MVAKKEKTPNIKGRSKEIMNKAKAARKAMRLKG